MSVRRLMAMAGGLAIAFAAVPRVQLHAQLEALRQDTKFIFDAASSNLFEIRLGQLAESKAINASVKQFAQQMVTDHSNLESQLAASVSKGGTSFKPSMSKEHQQEVDSLGKISGAEFDRAYMTSMIRHHQQDVATFQSAGSTARSSEARQIVTTGLPVLQRHLSMATQVGGQVGATGGVAVTTPGGPVTTPNPPVVVQNPTTPISGQVTAQSRAEFNADMPFVRAAASSNIMEIRLGQLAQSRAANLAVKQFGQRMVTDHTTLQNQLTSTASGMGQTLQPVMEVRHEQEVNRLDRVYGREFDRAYMSLMIRGHQEDVTQFQTQGQSARSVQVRNLATNALPILQQHLSLAVQVGSQVGADTTRNVAGPTQPGGGNRNVRADAEFIRDVGADNQMQIQLGELARERARNRAVREFADRIVTDHTRLQNQWTTMATRNGMPFKPGMGTHHREKVEQLEKVNGRNFDRAYMILMIQQHSDEVSYWQKEGRASRSAEVRRLVDNGLPILEQHFSQAKQIGRQIGVNPDAALRNRKDIEKDKNKDKDKDR